MSAVYESTVSKAWSHRLEGDAGELTCFTLRDIPSHAFHGPNDWLPLLQEAVALDTRVRVMASEPDIVKCADPMCGDGCCEDPDCTNAPEGERATPFLLRADIIEWL